MRIRSSTISQKKVKHFLNKLSGNGDAIATVLRSALEVETWQDSVNKYQCDSKIGNNMEVKCKEYLDVLKATGLPYGKIETWCSPLPVTIIGSLPDGNTVAYRCSQDAKWNHVPKYIGVWDGDFQGNRAKIEQNILAIYGDQLYDIADPDNELRELPLF
jgi:hypothetical protein